MPRASSFDDLIFEAHQGVSGFEQIAPDWSAFVESMPGARFNHFPEWYRAYLLSLEQNPNGVWIIAGYRNRKLVGVFPLHFQDFRAGILKPRLLGTIEEDQLQLSDFVFEQIAENEGLLDSLTRWLRIQRDLRWDGLRLRKVSSESAIAYAARARMPKGTIALQYFTSAYFHTNGSFEQATPSMTAKFRSNLRRRNRLAEQTAPLRLQVVSGTHELEEAFRLFLELEASGWKGEAGTSSAIRCEPPMLAFYAELVRAFGRREQCCINLLWHGEVAVAGQFCLKIGNVLNILKVGFSEPHSIFAPGLLLLERVIRHTCDDPRIDVLHLVNEPPWAKFFRPIVTGVWSYFAPSWSARGLIVHAALLMKRKREARTGKWAIKETGQTD